MIRLMVIIAGLLAGYFIARLLRLFWNSEEDADSLKDLDKGDY